MVSSCYSKATPLFIFFLVLLSPNSSQYSMQSKMTKERKIRSYSETYSTNSFLFITKQGNDKLNECMLYIHFFNPLEAKI